MKVLVLCNHTNALNSGGHQRLSHLLKAIAAAGEVTLVYPIIAQRYRPGCPSAETFLQGGLHIPA